MAANKAAIFDNRFNHQIHFVGEHFILKIHQNTTQPIIPTLLTFRSPLLLDRNVNSVRTIDWGGGTGVLAPMAA